MDNLTIRELMIQLITRFSTRDEVNLNRVTDILKKRTGEKFATDVGKWVRWYLTSKANEEDKGVVETAYKLFRENNKYTVSSEVSRQ